MPIALRQRGASRAPLAAIAGFAVRRERDPEVMAALQQRSNTEMQGRFDAGHRAHVATVNGVPAAWGWVATVSATIGELQVAFAFSREERYLWNFVTRAAFRGRGIYPRLLDAIVDAESLDADRFWIVYAPENHASGAGIQQAGITLVGELSFDRQGTPVVRDIRAGGAAAVSRRLGVADTRKPVAQCWKCAREAGSDGIRLHERELLVRLSATGDGVQGVRPGAGTKQSPPSAALWPAGAT